MSIGWITTPRTYWGSHDFSFFSHKDVPTKVSSSFIDVAAACDVGVACDAVVEASKNLTTWGLNSNRPSPPEERVLLFESVVFWNPPASSSSSSFSPNLLFGWTRKLIVGVGWEVIG